MLDYGECSEAVIFQLKNPLRIIEWQAPALQWHGLELKGHHFTQNSRFTIIVHGQSKGAAIKTRCSTAGDPSATRMVDARGSHGNCGACEKASATCVCDSSKPSARHRMQKIGFPAFTAC